MQNRYKKKIQGISTFILIYYDISTYQSNREKSIWLCIAKKSAKNVQVEKIYTLQVFFHRIFFSFHKLMSKVSFEPVVSYFFL